MSGHYGELVFGQRHELDILFSPMIYTLPSFLSGHVAHTLTCPRVMATPENIKARFLKEGDVFAENDIAYVTPFAENDIAYVTPFVSLDEPIWSPGSSSRGCGRAAGVDP
jgi:predicted nucleotide-binding protein (sugar kinase/HSP70/actin superfamily)